MFNLFVRPEAIQDLAAIKKASAMDHARVLVLLQEIYADRTLLSQLAEDGVSDLNTFKIDVTAFGAMQRLHFDMWRIKSYECGKNYPMPYRLIYAVDNVKMDYHIFAIMKRNEGTDYENDPELVARIRNVYLQLGLPFAEKR
ncbi:hypothetical protein ACPUET_23540 [Paraburkholderia graminis]|uniref:hypothetical protein n=1 Tax=Paraburkholderia graminis TaxID=60548 RepID=UPI003C88FEC4